MRLTGFNFMVLIKHMMYIIKTLLFICFIAYQDNRVLWLF